MSSYMHNQNYDGRSRAITAITCDHGDLPTPPPALAEPIANCQLLTACLLNSRCLRKDWARTASILGPCIEVRGVIMPSNSSSVQELYTKGIDRYSLFINAFQ